MRVPFAVAKPSSASRMPIVTIISGVLMAILPALLNKLRLCRHSPLSTRLVPPTRVSVTS